MTAKSVGDTHSLFEGSGGWGEGKNEMLSDVRWWGIAGVLHVQSFFFIKENWICAITIHHAEPNNILLIRNFRFDTVKPSFNDTTASFVG